MRFQIHMGVSASDIVYSLALTNKKENIKPRMVPLTKGQQYGKRLSHGEVIRGAPVVWWLGARALTGG